jgi:hypothetical protein
MGQTHDEITQNLAERLCWQVARRDDTRVARRLYRTQVVDGVYRLEAGALLDDFFHFLQAIGVMALLEQVHGAAIHREMVPFVQYLLLYGVKTLCGMKSINALPRLLFSDEALMQLGGFNAQQVRQGVCRRGTAKRQRARRPGPICPDTLANNMVKCNVRELETLFNGAIRAVAKAGVVGKRVTGIAAGTDLETTERYAGWGQAPRKRRIADKWGKVHAIEVTVYGWKVLRLIEAVTKMPLAVKVGPIQAPEALCARALVTQARMNLAGYAHLAQVVFEKGFLDGTTLGWLDQQGSRLVVPAKANMAVTADARALAAAGEGVTVGQRVHTVRHGPGQGAWTERLETEVVGITGLTRSEQYGTEAHGRRHHRRDFEPNPIHAVVVRKWHGKDYGPGGKTVFLTNAAGQQPLKPFDDDDDRSRIENCCIKAAKQQWDLGHPPQKSARAVRVHVLCTLLMFALATAYRWPYEKAALGEEPVGWQRWRRQLLEQSRDKVIVFAQGYYGIFHVAEYSLLLGAKRKDVPPEIGTLQEVLAKYGRTAHG